MLKKLYSLLIIALFCTITTAMATEKIRITTNKTDLIFTVTDNGRLFQSYLGPRLNHESDIKQISGGIESFITNGMEDYYESAIKITHSDGNPSLLLTYASHSSETLQDGGKKTEILLIDEEYPIEVKLIFIAYDDVNVIKSYSEVVHKERKPITIYNCASSMLHFNRKDYYLSSFNGDWAREAKKHTSKLTVGKKIIDTKLGTRAAMFTTPLFELSFDKESEENSGEVILGTLGWCGNFSFTFEIDHENRLRVASGINPHSSEYHLEANEVFKTPEFIFSYSINGVGEASREMHNWARKYQIKDGMGDRMTLLNNWEATFFDFNQEKLGSIMEDAAKMGVDMFLLDDGWFGTKYPRNDDTQGLGDWTEIKDKLPDGIGYLTKKAQENGIKFGLWIEPEMVNPKSELYEKHKDWVIHLPNREEYRFRNQMVLDLSNPEVQDYVYEIVDDLLTKYPDIAYFKWDCNSPITNIYSPYLKDKQSHLYIEHTRGIYNVLERVDAKYPNIPMMMCAGGSGRCDYETLKYFTEFWLSDNTDPIERIFIQWGYSHFFPAKATSAHVTNWNSAMPIKFRVDVAMMGKLGFDIIFKNLSSEEQEFSISAISEYNRLKDVILDGDLYRLASPYKGNHTSSMYIGKDKSQAVVFAFDMEPRYGEYIAEYIPLLKLDGLEANQMYRIEEINLMPNEKSTLPQNGTILSGEYLMNIGIKAFTGNSYKSRVIEVTKE